MKGKHSTPAFFFLYHPDRDSREFAALARKEGYDRILLLRRETRSLQIYIPFRQKANGVSGPSI